MTQMRFQTLAIFLAAVGFIVGLGHLSRPTGALLFLLTLGLWIIDLRSRDRLSKWRDWGAMLEAPMGAAEGQLFSDRTG
jgi:4-amino-4-deoxy-L-arabinose transferase-like glycosyltransferase